MARGDGGGEWPDHRGVEQRGQQCGEQRHPPRGDGGVVGCELNREAEEPS